MGWQHKRSVRGIRQFRSSLTTHVLQGSRQNQQVDITKLHDMRKVRVGFNGAVVTRVVNPVLPVIHQITGSITGRPVDGVCPLHLKSGYGLGTPRQIYVNTVLRDADVQEFLSHVVRTAEMSVGLLTENAQGL